MTALALSLLGNLWPYILAALAAVWWGWKQRRAGRAEVEAKIARAEAEARDIAENVQNDIGALTPEQRRERLRTWARD